MHKAKLILFGIVLVGIGGGAFAFKTARTPHVFYTNGIGNICTTTTTILFSVEDLAGGQESQFIQGVGRVANFLAPCPGLHLYPAY
jgi:hypothetical protein